MFEKPIINNYWTRLSKISWFVCGEQINIICQSRRLRQIIDLRDTDKSWYFALTKFYQSITEFVFSMNILGKWSNLPFSRKSNHKKEKARFPLCMSRILVAAKHSWTALHMSRPFCRQLFAGHVVGSRPMKRKKKFVSNDFALLFIQNIFLFLIGWNIRLILHNQQALKRRTYT